MGDCPAGTGPADPVQCACSTGFNGNGEFCTKLKLPRPEILSIAPSAGYCVKSDQTALLTVLNFPTFTVKAVSVSFQLGGRQYPLAGSTGLSILVTLNISGNLTRNSGTVLLSLPGPGPQNLDFGVAVFTISFTGGSSEPMVFLFEYKPYVVGPPVTQLSNRFLHNIYMKTRI